IVVYTKHARGLVVRFCAENNVRSLEELKAFGEEGYLLNDELSTENKLVFMR
ncbi:MAG: peroxide stress protein YaaA, partial [Flavobacteriaceae bacterium]|nr:peroxide stress protein YaaA [Flavobacteriaceae bacterium]